MLKHIQYILPGLVVGTFTYIIIEEKDYSNNNRNPKGLPIATKRTSSAFPYHPNHIKSKKGLRCLLIAYRTDVNILQLLAA